MGSNTASLEDNRRIKMVLEGSEGGIKLNDGVLVYGKDE